MSTNIEVGQVVKGKITGIQPYGAFVSLGDNVQGLIHISEITHGYVKDISTIVEVGQEVEVKVLFVEEDGNKVGLSLRALMEEPKEQETKPSKKRAVEKKTSNILKQDDSLGFNTLKDKLKEWIQQSEIK